MCGSTRSTISPSSSSTRRSTPCAAGCCGPKLMVKFRMLCSVISQTSVVMPRLAPARQAHACWASRLRFLVPRQHVVRALPRGEKVEVAELLCQLDGLVDDPLLLFVVAQLNEAGEREIFSQRMALEAVVRQDAAQVRVA